MYIFNYDSKLLFNSALVQSLKLFYLVPLLTFQGFSTFKIFQLIIMKK